MFLGSPILSPKTPKFSNQLFSDPAISVFLVCPKFAQLWMVKYLKWTLFFSSRSWFRSSELLTSVSSNQCICSKLYTDEFCLSSICCAVNQQMPILALSNLWSFGFPFKSLIVVSLFVFQFSKLLLVEESVWLFSQDQKLRLLIQTLDHIITHLSRNLVALKLILSFSNSFESLLFCMLHPISIQVDLNPTNCKHKSFL